MIISLYNYAWFLNWTLYRYRGVEVFDRWRLVWERECNHFYGCLQAFVENCARVSALNYSIFLFVLTCNSLLRLVRILLIIYVWMLSCEIFIFPLLWLTINILLMHSTDRKINLYLFYAINYEKSWLSTIIIDRYIIRDILGYGSRIIKIFTSFHIYRFYMFAKTENFRVLLQY